MSQAQDLLAELHRSDETVDDHRDALEVIAREDTAVGKLVQSLLNSSEAEA